MEGRERERRRRRRRRKRASYVVALYRAESRRSSGCNSVTKFFGRNWCD
jgi:hypothetical protein